MGKQGAFGKYGEWQTSYKDKPKSSTWLGPYMKIYTQGTFWKYQNRNKDSVAIEKTKNSHFEILRRGSKHRSRLTIIISTWFRTKRWLSASSNNEFFTRRKTWQCQGRLKLQTKLN